MRVAYIIAGFPRASETFVTREVLALRAQGVDVEVFAVSRPSAAEVKRLPGNARALMKDVHYISTTEALAAAPDLAPYVEVRELNARLTAAVGPAPRPFLRLLRAAAIARHISRGNFDRIHAHWPHGTQLGLLVHALTRVPLSASVHAHEVEHEGAHFPIAFERLEFAVFCNQAAMERLLTRLPPDAADRCHLIYHGVDLKQFRQTPLKPANGQLRIFSAGRLTPTKGFDRLVRALAAARDAGFPIHLTIAGEGAERAKLERLVQELGLEGQVTLPGWIPHDEMASLIDDCHAGALLADCSYHDGLPNVVLEAMAKGRPMIVSPLPAAREAIAHGENGFILSAPDAYDHFVTCVRQLAASPDLCARLGNNARNTMERRFDEASSAAQMVQLFRTPRPSRPSQHVSRRPSLSVVTIAKDEARDLPHFLENFLQWADEVIVVDDGSTDRTAGIAQSAGPRVRLINSPRKPGEGFHSQRNKGIAAASGDWLLHVDVDMRMPPELAREVRAAICRDDKDLYSYRIAHYFLNRPLRHAIGAERLYPWLVRKGAGKFDSIVHEKLNTEVAPERRGVLENRMYHLGDNDFEERLRKNVLYSGLERSRHRAQTSSRALIEVLVRPPYQALRSYISKMGFLDGRAGAFWALYQLSGSMNRYLLEYSDHLKLDRNSLEALLAGGDRPDFSEPQPTHRANAEALVNSGDEHG